MNESFINKTAKYYLINFPFGDSGVSEIVDDMALEFWLKSGSLKEGDLIIEAKNVLEVKMDKKFFVINSLSETEKKEEK